ncbi:MAG TPA: hypothetical protein VFM39_01325 [bacterium]|nr:hypothetical protein [bacterium]
MFIPTLYPRGALLFWVSGDLQLTTDRHVPFDATGPGARLYFSWDIDKVPNATGVLWQVSRIDFPPFAGGGQQDLDPHGLVLSGRGVGRYGTFAVDIAALAKQRGFASAPRILTRQSQTLELRYPFRVRVIPVGGRQQKAVGQPSNTLTAYYGKEPQQPPIAIQIPHGSERQGQAAVTRVSYRFMYSYRTPPDCDTRGGNRDPLIQFVDVIVEAWEWVTKFYNNVKKAAVDVVTAILPLPDSVVSYALDAALLAAGIPPSLPNLDQLMDEGADYLAMTAVQQAGLPVGDEMARDALKKGIRAAADEAARQARKAASTEGKACEWRDVPSRLTITLRNDDVADLVDVKISAGTIFDLYPGVGETIPLLKRGESMAIPLVIYPSLSRRYFDGQLYRGGTLWFEALHRERTEFKIIVTGKLAQPDGPYTRVRREFTTPGRIWNKDHVMTF